jgi:hypothetical protein
MLAADEALCRRAAGLLFCAPEPVILALEGEPVEVLLGMVRWCIEHEAPDFDPEKVLPAWAKKRGRGRWSDRPNQAARTIWGEVPATLHGCDGCGEKRRDVHEVGADSLTFFEGDLICEACAANHGVTI